jgi:hypothetical protein
MDHKAIIEEQITILKKLQSEIVQTNSIKIIEKSETAVRVAEEINILVAHARSIRP